MGPNTQFRTTEADSSDADIIDNTISNAINDNGEDGILVGRNSGVDLGRATGTDLDQLPNSTTVNNTGFGIRCLINSYADGRQEPLTVAPARKAFLLGVSIAWIRKQGQRKTLDSRECILEAQSVRDHWLTNRTTTEN